jgi:hypothetical protein
VKAGDARKYALSLPEAAEAPHFNYASFRVRGKIFATMPPDEAHLHVFVPDEDRDPAVELHPEAVEKLWWGKKVVGLRLTLVKAKPAMVRALLKKAWAAKAPKALAAQQS